jgi:RNA polymerase sigma-70 factor (ECF subfamily)
MEMLSRIAEGEEQAFYRLFKQYYAPLVLYAEKFDLGREDAEDVTMNVLGKLWKGREKMPEIRYLPAFLYKAVKNGCLDLLKKRKRAELANRVYGEQIEDEDYAVREAIRVEVLRRISEDIQALPEKYRIVFELTYYKGLNTRQIAEQLGLSVTNVTTRRSRALLLLKKELLKKDLLFLYFLLLWLK